jgi:hypothetical protein
MRAAVAPFAVPVRLRTSATVRRGTTAPRPTIWTHLGLPPMPAARAGLGLATGLYWELIPGDEHGDIVGVICPDCLTLREQRAIQPEKARVLRRLKRGLPSS